LVKLTVDATLIHQHDVLFWGQRRASDDYLVEILSSVDLHHHAGVFS
jgi:hypothetical protein